MSEIQTALSWWSILIALGFSVVIGMAAGVYPAFRAAMLDPIEALRHE
jgi:putative ABC transport system permease protein